MHIRVYLHPTSIEDVSSIQNNSKEIFPIHSLCFAFVALMTALLIFHYSAVRRFWFVSLNCIQIDCVVILRQV